MTGAPRCMMRSPAERELSTPSIYFSTLLISHPCKPLCHLFSTFQTFFQMSMFRLSYIITGRSILTDWAESAHTPAMEPHTSWQVPGTIHTPCRRGRSIHHPSLPPVPGACPPFSRELQPVATQNIRVLMILLWAYDDFFSGSDYYNSPGATTMRG